MCRPESGRRFPSGGCLEPEGSLVRTTKFNLTIGCNKGYGHDNKVEPEVIARVWQVQCASLHNELGIMVGGTLVPERAVYPAEFGCPMDGEKVGILVGVRNPEFCQDDEAWRGVVRTLARRLKLTFQQATAYLEFAEVEFEYLKG